MRTVVLLTYRSSAFATAFYCSSVCDLLFSLFCLKACYCIFFVKPIAVSVFRKKSFPVFYAPGQLVF